MKIITEIRQNLFHKEVLKKKNAFTFISKPVTLEKARNIGILFDATNQTSRQAVLSFMARLKEQGKKVTLLAFLNESQPGEKLPFQFFHKKEIDWKGRPVTEKADAFIREKFDMLFCLYLTSTSPLEYIAVQSLAKFKIGAHQEKTSCFDLTVVPDQQDTDYLIEQITFFLSKLTTAVHEEITT